eukprot:TRINITY_DN4470_c0_g1_i4.p1 TRINITY_DN4470_c0_g1~~TRINITY_DN4470_c0_g1_i4.p1  ORF type:complete len:771 (-),score=188.69 TRINITY_DN4470_c0_g1_i4:114-2426(-)
MAFDTHVTMWTYFTVPDGQMGEFKAEFPAFYEGARSGTKECLYFGFAIHGSTVFWRAGYKSADGVLAHLTDVGKALDKALALVGEGGLDLAIMGPSVELDKLRGTMGPLGTKFFEADQSCRWFGAIPDGPDRHVTLVPDFTVADGKIEELKQRLSAFYSQSNFSDEECIYLGCATSGNKVVCREGYKDASGVLAAYADAKAPIHAALEIGKEAASIALVGPAAELAKLKETFEALGVVFFETDAGCMWMPAGLAESASGPAPAEIVESEVLASPIPAGPEALASTASPKAEASDVVSSSAEQAPEAPLSPNGQHSEHRPEALNSTAPPKAEASDVASGSAEQAPEAPLSPTSQHSELRPEALNSTAPPKAEASDVVSSSAEQAPEAPLSPTSQHSELRPEALNSTAPPKAEASDVVSSSAEQAPEAPLSPTGQHSELRPEALDSTTPPKAEASDVASGSAEQAPEAPLSPTGQHSELRPEALDSTAPPKAEASDVASGSAEQAPEAPLSPTGQHSELRPEALDSTAPPKAEVSGVASSSAGQAAEAPLSPSAQHFDLSAEDDEVPNAESEPGTSPGSSFDSAFSNVGTSSAAAAVTDGPEAAALAADVRERLKFLCPDDQKTVCRRQCQLAQKEQEALQRQLQATIKRYTKAIETAKAVANCTEGRLLEELGLGAEVISKYEERIAYLQSIGMALDAEPTVSLPRLTPLEQAKGFAFASYASTAVVANKLKEKTEGAAPVLQNARSAFASFASRLSFSGGGYGGSSSAGH